MTTPTMPRVPLGDVTLHNFHQFPHIGRVTESDVTKRHSRPIGDAR